MTTSTETMHTPQSEEVLSITERSPKSSDKKEMEQIEESTVLVADEQALLRLPSSEKEMVTSTVIPTESVAPKSALAVPHKNPYLTTD